jgi:ATP-dependent RNA helicase HelY
MLFDILDAKVPATEETLDELHRRELLPCIWFLFSRVGCDSCVMRMHTQGVVLVDSEEQAAIKEAVDALM